MNECYFQINCTGLSLKDGLQRMSYDRQVPRLLLLTVAVTRSFGGFRFPLFRRIYVFFKIYNKKNKKNDTSRNRESRIPDSGFPESRNPESGIPGNIIYSIILSIIRVYIIQVVNSNLRIARNILLPDSEFFLDACLNLATRN